MKKLNILLVLSILLFSCSSPSAETSDESTLVNEESSSRSASNNALYNDLLIPGSGGVFRGVSFDMPKDQVRGIETNRSDITIFKDEEPTELIVTSNMGEDVLNFADITYSFDEKGLYNIKVETYTVEKGQAEEVFNLLIADYTKKYGAPSVADDGFYEFLVKGDAYNYKIAAKNIDDLEESFGMYIYYYLDVESQE